VLYQNISPFQTSILIEQLRATGEMTIAAHAIGIPVKALRQFAAQDPALGDAIAEALEQHAAMIYVEAHRRATVGGSDALMNTVLSAKHVAFDKEARKQELARNAKPAGITIKVFSEEDDSSESDVTDVVDKQQPGTTASGEPLRITMRWL